MSVTVSHLPDHSLFSSVSRVRRDPPWNVRGDRDTVSTAGTMVEGREVTSEGGLAMGGKVDLLSLIATTHTVLVSERRLLNRFTTIFFDP